MPGLGKQGKIPLVMSSSFDKNCTALDCQHVKLALES